MTFSPNFKQIQTPQAVSVYPSLGKAYLAPARMTVASSGLVKTGKNYYDSLEQMEKMIANGELPEGTRFSTAGEELALQRKYEIQGKDPKKSDEFRDHMGKGRQGYVWGHTLTGLRVPKGWEEGRKDTGTGKYPRIVLVGDKEVGKIQVAEGGGLVIVEFDDVFGVATEVRDLAWPHRGYNAHWYFDPNPRLDEKSGHYDVAVGRWVNWHHDEDGCLDVDADYWRWGADSGDGFRPVQGPVPEIEKFRLEKLRG